MNLLMLFSQFGYWGGNAQMYGDGLFANSLSDWDQTTGFMADRFGSQAFSFGYGALGHIFDTGGQTYSLMPDFVSKSLFGPSWSVYQNGFNLGSLWSNTVTPSFGWSGPGLSTKLASGMISALRSSRLC